MTILMGAWLCLGAAVVLSIPLMVFGAKIGYKLGFWVGQTIRKMFGL